MNLAHKPEVLREISRAETMKTAIHQDAENSRVLAQTASEAAAAAVSRGSVDGPRGSVALSREGRTAVG